MPRITLAAPYTDGDGKKHKADSTVDVEKAEKNRLLAYGLGREPSPAPAESATDKKSQKAPERVDDTKKES